MQKEIESLKKIESTISIENFSILTDTGFEKVNKLHKTIPYEVYLLKLADGRNLRCADNHIVFYKNGFEEIFVKNLNKGDKICTNNEDILSETEVLSIENLGYRENMYDFELSNNSNHRYYTNDILSHNTSIVEGLAIRIANKNIDPFFLDKKIYEINLSHIVSGTKYRGQFEERMKELVKEIEENPDIIIFIDEIHNIIGAGGTSGSMDAANIIKPALAKGELRCIGATTYEDYKKTIENDSALERRFQKIHLSVPSKDETLEIINSIKSKYENHHGVTYSEKILKSIVDITDRYINNRNFPDKAIDMMDEVGSYVKLHKKTTPQHIVDLQAELTKNELNKGKFAKEQRYEEAAKMRDICRELQIKITIELENWRNNSKKNKYEITSQDISHIISTHTGIPMGDLDSEENNKLSNMGDFLKSKLIGQDEIIDPIVTSIQKSRLGIQDPNKPLSVMLFLGPTGTGKTHLAKLISKYVFSNEKSFIRLDMSEFQEKHSVSRLIGSSPGYVGYDEKGFLTEKVKNNPYSLILLDEIEKAHPDISNVLLQVFEDGRLTDTSGHEVNFKNTIIIMTSNIGTSKIMKEKTLGFASKTQDQDIKDIIGDELKKFFRPELINRIDSVMMFNPLKEEDMPKIVSIELETTFDRLRSQGYIPTATKNLLNYLSEVGYNKEFGARPLKRAISEKVENKLAESVINKTIKSDEEIIFDFKSGVVTIENKKPTVKKKKN